MRALTAAFVVMAAYGSFTGHTGGAVMALILAIFVIASRMFFDLGDKAHATAQEPLQDTALDKHECETARSEL
jgi:hypothetical protein